MENSLNFLQVESNIDICFEKSLYTILIKVVLHCGGVILTIEVIFLSRLLGILGADIRESLFNGKTYSGLRKIFPILQRLSAGVMINGSMYFEEVPIQTLIGEFKKQTDFDKISTIKAIKDEFIKFLSENTNSTATDDYIRELVKPFKEELSWQIIDDGFLNTINSKKRRKTPVYIEKYSSYSDEFFDIIPDNVDRIEYNQIIWDIFSYELQFEGTGLIFAGYDEKNHFPSFFEINIFFNDNGNIVYDELRSGINVKKPLLIVFAVNQEAYTFITGVHEDFIDFIVNYIFTKNEGLIEDLRWSLDDEGVENVDIIMDIVKDLIYEKFGDVEIDINEYRRFTIEDTSYSLEHLPPWLISVFVDLLIYLTAVKQKTSSQHESVSMETNIAIITKNGGFKFVNNNSRTF